MASRIDLFVVSVPSTSTVASRVAVEVAVELTFARSREHSLVVTLLPFMKFIVIVVCVLAAAAFASAAVELDSH